MRRRKPGCHLPQSALVVIEDADPERRDEHARIADNVGLRHRDPAQRR